MCAHITALKVSIKIGVASIFFHIIPPLKNLASIYTTPWEPQFMNSKSKLSNSIKHTRLFQKEMHSSPHAEDYNALQPTDRLLIIDLDGFLNISIASISLFQMIQIQNNTIVFIY